MEPRFGWDREPPAKRTRHRHREQTSDDEGAASEGGFVIGYVTDSSSQITSELADRYRVEVVPTGITIDGEDHLEGVDLDTDDFYAAFGRGVTPTVSTSAPTPGELLSAYERLVARGCEEIISVHVGSQHSATLEAARLAARRIEVPVRLVDTGVASFGVTCCLWEAARAREAGASVDDTVAVAETTAARLASVFVLMGTELADAGGRYGSLVEGASMPVIRTRGPEMDVLAEVGSGDEAVEVMTDAVLSDGPGLIAAVGLADLPSRPLTNEFASALERDRRVEQVIRYRVGPSVGAHTGPGTLGGFHFVPA